VAQAARVPARAALEGDTGDIAGAPDEDEEVDEVLWDAEMSKVRPVCSFSSWSGAEVPLKLRRAEMSFWRGCLLRFATRLEERRTSPGALEHGRANGTRGKAWGTGGSTNLMDFCGSNRGLRQTIPSV
jgi:hypothetical protein